MSLHGIDDRQGRFSDFRAGREAHEAGHTKRFVRRVREHGDECDVHLSVRTRQEAHLGVAEPGLASKKAAEAGLLEEVSEVSPEQRRIVGPDRAHHQPRSVGQAQVLPIGGAVATAGLVGAHDLPP